MIPTEEEFEIWRDDPVTRFVLAVCRKTAGEVFDSWVQRAWQSNSVDSADLLEARTRADAYLALEQSDYSDWVAKSEAPDADVPLPVNHLTRHISPLDDIGHEDDGYDAWIVLAFIGSAISAFVAGAIIF